MISKNNVINLEERRKKMTNQKAETVSGGTPSPITDISDKRQEIINEERRTVKRTILTEFIGASVVVPGQGLLKVSLYDISDSGLAFDIESTGGQFKSGEEVAFRVYMNHKTYFPFTAKVTHVKKIDDEGVLRHGARFMDETLNKEALFHFVKFIENVSTSLKSDHGDVMVSNLK